MTPQIRTAIYSILAAITPLIVAYGLMSQEQAALWLALAKSIVDALALILATVYVPRDATDEPPTTPEATV